MIDAQAYVLRESGKIPELEEVRVSDELETGQVKLRVLYSGLCATQMEEIFSSSRNRSFMPHVFGHEGVGVIESVGDGVVERKIGDTCVIHWRKSTSGLDANPGRYFSGRSRINGGKVVTFCSTVVVPENRTTPLPENFSLEYGPLLGCSLTTGWGSLVKVGKFQVGESVLVAGLGAVGTFAALSATLLGARDVTGIDPKGFSESQYSERGVSRYFSTLSSMLNSLKGTSNGLTQDLIIDTSGDATTIETLLELAPPTSRIVLVGMPRGQVKPGLPVQRLLDGLKVFGSNGGCVNPGEDFSKVSLLFDTRMKDWDSDLIRTLRLDELRGAISLFNTGTTLRVVLDMQS